MRKLIGLIAALTLLAGAVGGTTDAASAHPGPNPGKSPHVVDITSDGHSFEAPEGIPSGWTTVRYHNNTHETHFALFALLPEHDGSQITVADTQAEVAPVFQEAMDLINAGKPGEGFAALGELPEWELTYMGGPGFVAPGEVAETTLYLEPGLYQIECYVKTDGVFHATPHDDGHGMVAEMAVTDEDAGAREPRADLELAVSSDGGIEIDGDVRPGRQTIAVHFEDQIVHGHGLGHDVHVARIDDDTDLEELATWMNWAHPEGLEVPAPVEFLGGTHPMPEGHTAYVTVHMTPGQYAFVAEVDEPRTKDMLETVTVPRGQRTGR